MTEATHSKPEAEAAAVGRLFGSALVQGGELWMNTHKELLANLGAMVEGWLQLNRAALDTSARALRKLHEYPSLAELFQLPQEWASEYWHCAASTADEGVRTARPAATRPHEPAKAGHAEIRVKREAATAAE